MDPARPLERQLRAINGTPPRAGAIIVTMLMAFFAGMALGGLLTGSRSEPTRAAANEVASAIPYPGGTRLTMR